MLAKLLIVRMATGDYVDGSSRGGFDEAGYDLDAYQPIEAPWFPNALADLERIAADADRLAGDAS